MNTLHAYVNKDYPSTEIRHFKNFPELKASSSGQYGSKHFPTLLEKIKTHQESPVFFIDTRDQTHLEINNEIVTIKIDDNLKRTSNEIVERETNLASTLEKTRIVFERDANDKKYEIEDDVRCTCTVPAFIHQNNFENKYHYIRFAMDEYAPLTDVQVQEFLQLQQEIGKNSWIHTNSLIGGDSNSSMFFILLKDILENAASISLEEITNKYGRLTAEPIETDKNREKKLERNAFIKDFYAFSKKNQESPLSWNEWKNSL